MANHPGRARRRPHRAGSGIRARLQDLVNNHPDRLSAAVAEAAAVDPASIDWRAPLERDRFYRPVDSAFIAAIGLPQQTSELRAFWPPGGPRWDALAVVAPRRATDGVLLLDATPHPGHVRGSGPDATGDDLRLIQASLTWARDRLGADPDADWTTPWFHFTSRLAHVAFFRERLGIPAWLVWVRERVDLGDVGDVGDVGDPGDPGDLGDVGDVGDVGDLGAVARGLGFGAGGLPCTVSVVLPSSG